MKTVVICMRNLLFAQGIELALRATGDFRPYRVTPAQPGNAVPVCMAHGAQILLLEVTPQEGFALPDCLNAAREIRGALPQIKTAFLCDEVAHPELARSVMRCRQDGQIDMFFYASIPMHYLADMLDTL